MGNLSSRSSRSRNSRSQPPALPQRPALLQPLALPQPHLRPLSTPGSTPPHKRSRGTEDDDLQDEDSGDLNDLGQDLVIGTNYQSVEEVQRHLMTRFEGFNLILGIDFTKSNRTTGRRSNHGRSLHATGSDRNPYETVLNITGRTLSLFEGEHMINCFGFGEETTRDHSVFSFRSDLHPCQGMAEVLTRYRAHIPHLRFAEPTSFAPIINAAVDIVEESGGDYHILLIIADGPVKHSAMRATVDAIVNASHYPLSIIVVGVGDGPWNMIDAFVWELPPRQFDNFHFVNFTNIMQSNLQAPHFRDAQFAATLVKEIPLQCRAIMEKRLMGMRGTSPSVQVLPPPSAALDMDRQARRRLQPPQMRMSNLLASIPHDLHPRGTPDTSFRAPDEVDTEQICEVCCIGRKDTLFNCGHQMCYCCSTADSMKSICPFCRAPIETRIPLMPPGGIKSTHSSLEDIQEALRDKGLDSVKLILGIDFAKHAPAGSSLHTIGSDPNAVEQALTIVGRMLLPFLEDNHIYSFGFGDRTTQENRVFSFFSDQRPCERMGEVLTRYRAIVPHISGAGHSSFAPVINAAVGKVEESDGQDHILVIVTGNQVEDPVSQETKDAILNASSYPLSIVLVGVGDGPWNMMTYFADNLPARAFNNFHFVSLTQIMRSSLPPHVREAQFAAVVVKEIPSQYKADPKAERVGTYSRVGPLPLPPPPEVLRMDAQAYRAPTVDADSSGYRSVPRVPQMPTSAQLALTVHRPNPQGNAANSYTNFRAPGEDNTHCIVCATRTIDMALGCGHQVLCSTCATGVDTCPSCWAPITTRVRLY